MEYIDMYSIYVYTYIDMYSIYPVFNIAFAMTESSNSIQWGGGVGYMLNWFNRVVVRYILAGR